MKKQKIDFLITYEHKARELDAIVLLKQELEKRGYSVLIHSSYENDVYKFPCMANIRPKCVIVPAAYNYEVVEYFSFALVGFVNKIINLQWEQVLSVEEEADLNAYHNPKGFAQNVVHLCWGKTPQKRLILSGVPESNCIVTGPGHMDILRFPYNKKILNKENLSKKFSLELQKKWILFISSFALNDLTGQIKEYNRNAMGAEYFDNFYNFSVKSRTEILKWFDNYLSEHNDSIIIYRPHPDEVNKNNELKVLEQKYDNFKVISDLVITHWINSSDIILNWYSTSKAYVVLQNKFEYVLRPIPIERKYEVSIMDGDTFVTSYYDFVEVVTNDNRDKYPMRDISDYYDFDIHVPTYKRIADVCEETFNSNKYNLNIPVTYRIKYILRVYKNFIFLLLKKIAPDITFIKKVIEIREKAALFISEGYERNVASVDDIKKILDI